MATRDDGKHKTAMDKYYLANKEEICAEAKIRYEKDKRKARNSQLLAHFNMTIEQYEEILASQGGVCAICGRSPIGMKKSLAVDHSKMYGYNRGLLCGACNTGIGQLRIDSGTEILQKAIAYYELHKTKHSG